jgi:hypothetical protein
MIRILFLIIVCHLISSVVAQNEITTHDTLPAGDLPFFIHPDKRLPAEELEEKREGVFLTGLPRLEFDPIRGFGAGGNLFVFLNKTRQDPFFAYTPYRYMVATEFFIFENGRVRYAINFDAPFVFDSPWRIRADAVLWEDPHAQYWGIGRRSLRRLTFPDKEGGFYGATRSFARISDYEQNLQLAVMGEDGLYRSDAHFHHFMQREQLYNLSVERIAMGGRLRLVLGYEALFTAFDDYTGLPADEAYLPTGQEVPALNNETLIQREQREGIWERYNLVGFESDHQFNSMLAGAIMYDTRDFEPDPSRGIFSQYSHEYSIPLLGSAFDFHKHMLQTQVFHTLFRWRNGRSRVTFAGLAGVGQILGRRINFIEMWDLSSQAEAGGIFVLGGARSVRGYREARFIAPTVSLVNLELRARLYDVRLLNQHFAFGLTPFFDMGSVYDSLGEINFRRWRGAPGIGGRLAWNLSTILRLDYARSQEGSQVFFGFGHIF